MNAAYRPSVGCEWNRDQEHISVRRWAEAHAVEIEKEREARLRLRTTVLELLGVAEEELTGGIIATRLIPSSNVTDEAGKLFPDFKVSAGSIHFGIYFYNRFEPTCPFGWEFRVRIRKPMEVAHPAECMDEALGSTIACTDPASRYVATLTAYQAEGQLSYYLDHMTERPDVYDFGSAATVRVQTEE